MNYSDPAPAYDDVVKPTIPQSFSLSTVPNLPQLANNKNDTNNQPTGNNNQPVVNNTRPPACNNHLVTVNMNKGCKNKMCHIWKKWAGIIIFLVILAIILCATQR